eukprot:10271122-Ditylum_brightwellii.AAC.1
MQMQLEELQKRNEALGAELVEIQQKGGKSHKHESRHVEEDYNDEICSSPKWASAARKSKADGMRVFGLSDSDMDDPRAIEDDALRQYMDERAKKFGNDW